MDDFLRGICCSVRLIPLFYYFANIFMKKLFKCPLLTPVLLLACCAEPITVEADYQIIPLPQQITPMQGNAFVLNDETVIVYPSDNQQLECSARFLADYIAQTTGMELQVCDNGGAYNVITLMTGYDNDCPEAYRITSCANGITLDGAGEQGAFYAVQTLRKAIPVVERADQVLFPAVKIEDRPRFAYRAMHLDVARHLFPVDFIKKYIDLLALHNMNTFHWHLTDDQGWRLEIEKYPLLAQIGSVRKETLVGHLDEKPRKYDGKPYGGYYTKEQIREVVEYAAQRYVTIIPEIDLPGHMLGVLAAYPQLGCTGGPYEVATQWGVFDDILCAGKEETFEFVENMFTEVLELFPSEYIHVGGDEAPKTRWKGCPLCQQRIRELGIVGDNQHSAEHRLQSYFITRVEKFLNSRGRKLIGWDEILEGGIAPGATIMSWRGVEGGVIAARQKHDAIMVPYEYLYFDYYQFPDSISEPLAMPGCTTVEKVYSYEPLPADLDDDSRKHIIGAQANLWSEYIRTPEHAEYMALPRMDALCEVQWTQPELKDYASFLKRLDRMRAIYDRCGYHYATHVFENKPL